MMMMMIIIKMSYGSNAGMGICTTGQCHRQ